MVTGRWNAADDSFVGHVPKTLSGAAWLRSTPRASTGLGVEDDSTTPSNDAPRHTPGFQLPRKAVDENGPGTSLPRASLRRIQDKLFPLGSQPICSCNSLAQGHFTEMSAGTLDRAASPPGSRDTQSRPVQSPACCKSGALAARPGRLGQMWSQPFQPVVAPGQ